MDVEPLPNGNLLVASAYNIREITTAGSLIRTISLVAGSGQTSANIRGIEYKAATNDLFVTHVGHTGFFDKAMRLDMTTGVLETHATLIQPDDLFLTASGELLAGSQSIGSTPVLYDANLNSVGTLNGGRQALVTQFVPEPTIVALLAVAAGTMLLRRRR